jgi:hypothetical protein
MDRLNAIVHYLFRRNRQPFNELVTARYSLQGRNKGNNSEPTPHSFGFHSWALATRKQLEPRIELFRTPGYEHVAPGYLIKGERQ